MDFALCNQTEIVTDYEEITKADIGSDHKLVKMTLRKNERFARRKTMKKQRPFNINTQKLNDMKERFEINLKTDMKNLRRR